jgi:transposase
VTKIICGVDISKQHLDAGIWPGGAFGRFSNNAAGIAELAAFCAGHAVALVAMEATGGFERLAFGLLWEQGFPCAIANPRSVRQFAGAMGFLEKTDRIDAVLIARFALSKDLKPTPQPSKNQSRLKALVARLRQVTVDLTVNKQRLSHVEDAGIRMSLQEVITLLKRQSRQLEGEIASLIDDDPLWAALDQAFRTVKGVAGRTVARLVADLPEIGTYDNKAIAKTVGLAPLANDSGKMAGKRFIRGGRSNVRSILVLVAAVAKRHDPSLAEFARRLAEAGKPKMVIRVAIARKLLVRLNAKARDARAQLANAT